MALLKVVILGSGGSGKTSLIEAYCNRFHLDTRMTIGVQFHHVEIGTSTIPIQVWDFSGGEQFRSFISPLLRGASVILLCFDLSTYSSFVAVMEWHEFLRKIFPEKMPQAILVGLKSDLPWVVNLAEIKALQLRLSLPEYFETSAKNHIGLEPLLACMEKLGKERPLGIAIKVQSIRLPLPLSNP